MESVANHAICVTEIQSELVVELRNESTCRSAWGGHRPERELCAVDQHCRGHCPICGRLFGDKGLAREQINVTHHAGVVHLSTPLALCDFLPQIRQANIGAVELIRSLLSVLPRTSAFGARQAPQYRRDSLERRNGQ